MTAAISSIIDTVSSGLIRFFFEFKRHLSILLSFVKAMLSETYAMKLPLPVEFIDVEQNFNYRYRC